MPGLESSTPRGVVQERFALMEAEARERIHKVLIVTQGQLMRLDGALATVSPEGWSTSAVARKLASLRAAANKALERVGDMPGSAVTALAQGTRVPVKSLARELEKLATLVEPHVQPAHQGAASAPREEGDPARTGSSGREMDLGR